jgi:hypothetical protein
MRVVKLALVVAIAVAAPGLASAKAARGSKIPCGWRSGALADPASTHRCLAQQYRAAKPKPPAPAPAAPPNAGQG